MKAIFPMITAGVCAITLAGCSSAENEAPCKDFETTYNAVDLRDKLNVLDGSGDDYRPSLRKLGDAAQAGANKASGDVKKWLTSYVGRVAAYEKTGTDADLMYDFLDVRGWLDDDRDKLVDACKASGYPIELEPDHPVP